MSLPQFSTQSELFSTAGLSGTLFGPADRFRLFAHKVFPAVVRTRGQLEKCYCADNGRMAIEPVVLLGVSLLQYLEGVPDRQAVELLRYHAGWSFALNLQVGDEAFHPTTLVNFRQRLLEHDLGAIGFTVILEALVEAGLMARKSRQRLDATHMFGRVSRMSRLDCVRESLRLALLEICEQFAPVTQLPWWAGLWERYVETQIDYRTSAETLVRKMVEAGTDAQQLLEWLRSATAPEKLAQGAQAKLLATVFTEQYEVVSPAQIKPRSKEDLGSERVQNPHDPEATYATKGSGPQRKEHVGYKVQVAETVSEAKLEPGEPTRNFIAGIVTQTARESDEQGALKMDAEQQAMGLEKPPVQYVDAAYVSAHRLVEVAAEGRELIGPVPAAPNNTQGRFTSEAFQVAVEQRQALCPAGHQNSHCARVEEQATGKVCYRFEWDTATCRTCLLRQQCIRDQDKHRTLVVGEHHTALQSRRQEQQTAEFKKRMKHRNGIEGTQSELVRAHGLRQARYRGLAKARLQSYFTAAACNLKRWLSRLVWEADRASLTSPLPTALAAS